MKKPVQTRVASALSVPFLVVALSLVIAGPGTSTPSAADTWSQSGGLGAEVTITYSYSNLFDGELGRRSDFTEYEMLLAIEEALGLWASVAPLVFVESEDRGRLPDDDDRSYSGFNRPKIRIGHHAFSENTLGHAYFPASSWVGLAGDLHFDDTASDGQGRTWSESLFLYVAAHELGHSLGVEHIDEPIAVMNPTAVASRFGRLGGGFLYQPDIDAIQSLYGEGTGRVSTTRSFIGPLSSNLADNLWTTHANWDPGWMPTKNSNVTIDSGSSVRVDASVEAADLHLDDVTLVIATAGKLTVENALTMTGKSHLVVELGQRPANRITAGGHIVLDGGLTLEIVGDSPFQAGRYDLIRSRGAGSHDTAGITGQFDILYDLGAYVSGDGLVMESDRVSLIIDRDLHWGDANLDATTDVRDFNVWNTHKFTSDGDWTTGDFNGDGKVDVRDFNVWNTAKFTSAGSPPPPGSPQAVPEPSVLVLLAMAMTGLWSVRRRPILG